MRFFVLSLIFSLGLNLQAFDVPPLESPIIDQVGILTPIQKRELEGVIKDLWSHGGSQYTILIVHSLGEESIDEVSIRVVEAWQLGKQGKDNGVLMLIALQDQLIRMEVGRGLEGVIPDVIAHRIIRNVMAPAFERGDYYLGIKSATMELLRRSDPEFLSQKVRENPDLEEVSSEEPSNERLLFFIIFIVMILIWLFLGGGRHGGFRKGPWNIGGGRFPPGGMGGGSWRGGGGTFGGGGATGGWGRR